MRTRVLILPAALGLAAIAVALGWMEFRSVRQAEASIADLAKEQSRLAARIKAVRSQIAASVRSEAELRTAFRHAQAHQTSAARQAAIRPNMAELMAKNPNLRALFERSFRENLSMQFLPLFHALGLSPGQIEKFEDLKTEYEEDRMDIQAVAQSQGLAPSDPAIAALQQQKDEQLREAELGLLGSAGYQQLQQFDRILPLEGHVEALASYVALSSPLTSSQMEQLLNTLANASGNFQAGGKADEATIDLPSVRAQANQYLTGTQYAALEAGSQLWQVRGLLKQFYQTQVPTK